MNRVKRVLNSTKSSTVCERAVLADRPLSRMRGLLGRRGLDPGEGLLLTPAPAIHTAFMRFDIDAVFLDSELRVLRIVERLRPWKAVGKRHARSVLELRSGDAGRAGIAVGDRLELDEPRSATATPSASPGGAVESVVERAARGAVKASGLDDSPMHVMVLSSDWRFREVVSLLLARRGCEVSVGEDTRALADRSDERVEVVVIDAGRSLTAAASMVAAVEALGRPVGIVVVDDQPKRSLSKLQILPKWGSFELLFAAVEQAHGERAPGGRALGRPAQGACS